MTDQLSITAKIQSWIENKELVQIHSSQETEDFDVAYILHLESDYLTYAIVGADGLYGGIVVLHANDVQLFKANTIYLQELEKKVNIDSVYKAITDDLQKITEFTPYGVFSALLNTKVLIGVVHASSERFDGRVSGLSESTLSLDEYGSEYDRRYAQTYLRIEDISRVYLSLNSLRTITRSLEDKNL